MDEDWIAVLPQSMEDDSWYDDDPYLEDEAYYLNTIWEECTADLKSTSTAEDFSSFRSELSSFSNAQHELDRRDSEISIHSISSSIRLSIHDKGEDVESSSSSIISFASGDFRLQHHCQSTKVEKEAGNQLGDDSSLSEAIISDEILESEYDSESPRTSLCISSEAAIQSTTISPRSPLELLALEAAMYDSSKADNKNSKQQVMYSKRVDFTGSIVEYSSRALKRERILSKMEAIEETIAQAKDILGTHSSLE